MDRFSFVEPEHLHACRQCGEEDVPDNMVYVSSEPFCHIDCAADYVVDHIEDFADYAMEFACDNIDKFLKRLVE